MSLKSDKGKPRHILPRPFRSGKVGKNLASFRDGHDEARMPSALILNLSGPPFVDKRPSGAIPEEACRGPGPLPKGAGKVRVDFPREKGFAPGLRPHNAGSLGIIVTQSFLENCPGDDPPCISTFLQSSADPPFVENRPPVTISEDEDRDQDPPPKDEGKERGVAVFGLNQRNLKTSGTIMGLGRENWPGGDPLRGLNASQSSVDPPFVEDCPPGRIPEEAYRNHYPSPKDMKRVGKTTVHELDRHNLKTFRTLSEPFREKRSGDDPPDVLSMSQSSAEPPLVVDCSPRIIPEETYRDPDPPQKGTKKFPPKHSP